MMGDSAYLSICNFDPVVTGDTFGQRKIDDDGNLIISAYQFKVNFNITAYTIRLRFYLQFKKDPVKEISNLEGIDISDAQSGTFTIKPFIVDWENRLTTYDIEFTDQSGAVSTLIKGSVLVVGDRTPIPMPSSLPSPVNVTFIFPKGDKGDPGQATSFFVTTDEYGLLADERFAGYQVLKIEASGFVYYEGENFTKATDSTIIEMLDDQLPPEKRYLITIT